MKPVDESRKSKGCSQMFDGKLGQNKFIPCPIVQRFRSKNNLQSMETADNRTKDYCLGVWNSSKQKACYPKMQVSE